MPPVVPSGEKRPFGLAHAVPVKDYKPAHPVVELILAWQLRWKRRRLLWRSFRARNQLEVICNRTNDISPDSILGFVCLRNEAARLPYYLQHMRRLGVQHFLAVDNASTDGSADILADQPDVSLWKTNASYKASRFGVDWLTWLQIAYGHNHWCLTADADELLIYPDWQNRPLQELTAWLDSQGQTSFGTLMLDLYPKGPLGTQTHTPGQDPTHVLPYFDPTPYRWQVQPVMQNLWVQGGPRERVFFAEAPRRAPTLNKIPLVKWNRRFAYVNSTHSALPRQLNRVWQGDRTTGILLHTKFLPSIVEKSAEEKQRGEHFGDPSQYSGYYDQLLTGPDLWHPASLRYEGWQQLENLGLLHRGGWF